MTNSPSRQALLASRHADRIDLYDRAQQAGSAPPDGCATPERVQEWRRQWGALVARERCPVCLVVGEYSREWAGGGQLMLCSKDGGYVVGGANG